MKMQIDFIEPASETVPANFVKTLDNILRHFYPLKRALALEPSASFTKMDAAAKFQLDKLKILVFQISKGITFYRSITYFKS